MDSQLELVIEVFEKMINGELETSPEIIDFFKEEESREILRELISNLDFSDYLFDDQDLEEQQIGIQERLEDVLEVVIDINTRPVIYIYNNTFQLDNFAIGKEISSSIKSALEKAQTENILERAIKATCKISSRDRLSGSHLQHIGTGWLIAKNIIVTNSHVASYFATGDDNKPSFMPGREVSVDFIAEYNNEDDAFNPNKARFKVESVLYAHSVKTHYQTSRYPDIAFLQVSDKSEHSDISLPDPISLLKNPVAEDSHVVVIGYPAAPGEKDKIELRKQGFVEDIKTFGAKVLQPGQILKALDPNTNQTYKDQRIGHDCTTFGGNSGSILVDLETGKAVGLHFGGTQYKPENKTPVNFAVPVETIQKVAKEIGLDI
jgi:endonuclease G, mitochondrial